MPQLVDIIYFYPKEHAPKMLDIFIKQKLVILLFLIFIGNLE